MKYNTARPYSASYVIFKKDDKIAFVLRKNTDWMNNHYGLPSGKVEKRESHSAGAVREAREEVGVQVDPKDLKHVLTVHRGGDEGEESDWLDVYFEANKWQGELQNAEPHLHSELTWLHPENLPANIIPCVKHALESISKGLHYAEYGWNANAQ